MLGLLPTPLDVLTKAAQLECYKSLPETEGFLATLNEKSKNIFLNAIQKVRGIADLREKAIYIPQGQTRTKERFAQAHEITHQITPWHNLNQNLLDTEETLHTEINNEFEREANFGAAELLFQGDNFQKIARDYKADINAALTLANMHETSCQATLWKFAEVQDEKICIIQYYPSKIETAIVGFRRWKCIGSNSFINNYSDISIPQSVLPEHDWFAAIKSRAPLEGTCLIPHGEHDVNFEWSAWYNGYTLFVLLRRKPLIKVAGSFIQRINPPASGIILPSWLK